MNKIVQIDFDPLMRWIYVHRQNNSRQYRHTIKRALRLAVMVKNWNFNQTTTLVSQYLK